MYISVEVVLKSPSNRAFFVFLHPNQVDSTPGIPQWVYDLSKNTTKWYNLDMKGGEVA